MSRSDQLESAHLSKRPSLVQRKRLRARHRIVTAAAELFAARGFDKVSVTDIAEQAEVGRTTFFRYFGDKTEVVFAKEQAMLDAIDVLSGDERTAPATTWPDALAQIRPIVLELCRQATDDVRAYRAHAELLERHLELRARDALKSQQIAERLCEVLLDRGTEERIAVLAAQVALACCQTGKHRATTGAALVSTTEAAFEEVLNLCPGVEPRRES